MAEDDQDVRLPYIAPWPVGRWLIPLFWLVVLSGAALAWSFS